jgi:hypothetical protein
MDTTTVQTRNGEPAHESDRAGDGREETDKERLDRNMTELVNELRVALPGVQVLFAFLLVVPFNQRWTEVTTTQKDIYFATLMSTAITTALLMAPSALHRIQFRADDKKHIVMASNRYALVGFFFLALSVVGAVLFVTDFLFGTTQTIIATAAIAALFTACWYVLPSIRRARTS